MSNGTIKTCSIEGCKDKLLAKSLCSTHYQRLKRLGDVKASMPIQRKYKTPEESFAARTEWQGDCLVWIGYINPEGYGQIRLPHRAQLAHRYAWEKANGPIPDDLQIDHTCWNTACVNLDHLRLATSAENSSYLSSGLKGSKSGLRNVYRHGRGWMVQVHKAGTFHYFGTFSSIEEAKNVAQRARGDLFGDFAGRG